MRRIAMLVAVLSLLVVAFAGVALAVDRQCVNNPCQGTDNADTLFERGGNRVADTISGLGGADDIRANAFRNDTDVLNGNAGNDRLNARDGDGLDSLFGGAGTDRCFGDEDDPLTTTVDESDEFRNCEFINGVAQQHSLDYARIGQDKDRGFFEPRSFFVRRVETESEVPLGYIPENRHLFLIDRINPGLSQDVRVVFMVPPDSSGYEVEVTSGLFASETRRIALGF